MVQPPGFEVSDSNLVCKLNKALYGLKQAPRQWFDRLTSTLLQFGFLASKCDPSQFTYTKHKQVVYLLVYVDDIIITGSSLSLVHSLVQKLDSIFSLKQLGDLDYFLGIEVKQLSDNSLLLTQSKYIKDLLIKTNMVDCKPINTPMMSSCKLTKLGSPSMQDVTLYRFTSGAAIYFGPNLISWWSKKQQVVARSSTEAEYRSLAQATVPFTTPTIYCDNQSAVLLAHNPVLHSRTKHMESNLFFVREKVLAKQLSILHIPGTDQLADILTKAISIDKFLFMRNKLNVRSYTELEGGVPGTDQLADILTKAISTDKFLFMRNKLNVRSYTELEGGCVSV
ncbi:hypothetical protein L195_g026064 [Trifolium pratense]|uniref:Reverse transcriptase Ty1/copia-type domain-containing protein n=1 Tax=Trifolium pratense TaxID=57577 RepID=A0A2K3NI72_TRIPR|nr:hypothetical protein L195_g026064 [Trifolium pratense]